MRDVLTLPENVPIAKWTGKNIIKDDFPIPEHWYHNSHAIIEIPFDDAFKQGKPVVERWVAKNKTFTGFIKVNSKIVPGWEFFYIDKGEIEYSSAIEAYPLSFLEKAISNYEYYEQDHIEPWPFGLNVKGRKNKTVWNTARKCHLMCVNSFGLSS